MNPLEQLKLKISAENIWERELKLSKNEYLKLIGKSTFMEQVKRNEENLDLWHQILWKLGGLFGLQSLKLRFLYHSYGAYRAIHLLLHSLDTYSAKLLR